MKKLCIVVMFIMVTSVLVRAQSAGGDYNKGEVFAGYSVSSDGDSSALHGFNASGVYNFHQYIGVKVDGGANFRNTDFTVSVWERRLFNVAAGVQVKNNDREKTFKPYGHALVGYGEYRNKSKFGNSTFQFSQKGASLTVGGGFDIKVNKKIDVRAAQVDIVRIIATDNWTNLRFSSGIIFKF